jgi:hypothetical protein
MFFLILAIFHCRRAKKSKKIQLLFFSILVRFSRGGLAKQGIKNNGLMDIFVVGWLAQKL